MSSVDANDLQRVLKLCDEALERPVEQRDEFLSRSCGEDPQLRRAVDSLLISIGGAQAFLEPDGEPDLSSLIGQQIGDYRILRRLGEGGMGSVYLAERSAGEFTQAVAIKLVRRFMLSEELVRRFDSERQLLAALHHPYVARLIDGGTTADGLPYLVMEYVEGVPIDQYCNAHRLSITQRLELLQKVAMAVQAAHQNLIVHRDLKPANVLITEDGIPKLLDFGIAKLVDPARAGDSHTTVFGHAPMTPNYSSPEQMLEGKVTTAGDIYSLGVLAYELLTGSRPYELSGSTHPSLMRSIEALSFEKPSERLARQSTTDREELAKQRAVSPPQLARSVAGDLDRIVMKTLHRDPARRYESVGALSKDLGRYLKGLPIEARDDTVGYRVSKFVTRNKLAVSAASVTLVAILAGLGMALWQAGIAREQSRQAQAQLARAEAVSEFLGDIILAPSVSWDSALQTGPTATVADVLTAAEARLDEGLIEYPEVRLELYNKLSVAQGSMDRSEDALRIQLKALDYAEASLSPDSPLLVDMYYHMGAAYFEEYDLVQTEAWYRKAIALAEQHRSDEVTLIKLYALNDLGMVRSELHDFEGARDLMHEAIEGSHELFGPDLQPPHGLAYTNLATVYVSLGQMDTARKYFDLAQQAHELHPDQTENLGAILLEHLARQDILQGNHAAAQIKYRRALETYDEQLGVLSEATAHTTMRLAHSLASSGDLARARQHVDHVAEAFAEHLGIDESWIYYMALANVELGEQQPERAVDNIRTALRLGYEYEMSRFDRSDAKWLLARALKSAGRLAEAQSVYQELMDVESVWLPRELPYTQQLMAQTW